MSNEVLYILLPNYAAHEIVYLSEAIASNEYALKENPKYINKVVAPTFGGNKIHWRISHFARLLV